MILRKALFVLLAVLPMVLSAQEIPQKIQQEILSQHPDLDRDGDGEISIREFKRGRKSLPKEAKKRIDAAMAGTFEAQKQREIDRLLRGMGLRGELGIEYKTSKQGRTLLDIVYPKNKIHEKAPLLIFVHGGGYHGGDRSLLYGDINLIKNATDNGIAVATIGYSLVGKSEDVRMMHLNQDVKDALRYLAQNSDRFGIDPNKFITWGQSAGGSLALIAALTPNDHLPGAVSGPGTEHTVIGCIDFFGVTTFLEPSVVGARQVNEGRQNSWFDLKGGRDTEQTIIDCSPDRHLRSDSPPLLIFNGEKDPKVPVEHGRYMNRLAKELGADVTYVEIKNAGHGIKLADDAEGELSMTKPQAEQIITEHIVKWVNR